MPWRWCSKNNISPMTNSTGRPKVVGNSHLGLVERISSVASIVFQPSDTYFSAIASIAFDIGCLEIVGPLLVGGVVEVLSYLDKFDARRFAQGICKSTC